MADLPTPLQANMTASLAYFQSKKNYRYNGIFLEPVDPNIFPLYSQFVTTPMDLGTMKKKLDSLEYDLGDEGKAFWSDIHLIVDNCQAYNSRPGGVDRLTKKDFKYVNSVITGFRKLMVHERERFAKRLQKEREKVATVVPVPSHSSSWGGGASQRSLPPTRNKVVIQVRFCPWVKLAPLPSPPLPSPPHAILTYFTPCSRAGPM
jgi:hypothetical protein